VSRLQDDGRDSQSNRRPNRRPAPETYPPDDGQEEANRAGNAETGRADQDAAEFIIHVSQTPGATAKAWGRLDWATSMNQREWTRTSFGRW
jgi:hypothetical protein